MISSERNTTLKSKMVTKVSTTARRSTQKAIRSPIFIVGQPRSGSTLLRSVLSAHSRIALVNEPDLIMAMRKAGYTVDDSFDKPGRQELLESLYRDRGCRRHLQSIAPEIVQRFLRDDDVLSFKQVYERLLPRPRDTDVWGDKTVGASLFVIGDILKLYPRALCIHIARDPRAVLLSIYRKRMAGANDCLPPFCRESIAFFAYESMRWHAAMEALRGARQRYPAASIYELAYERFVADPDGELRALLAEIGVPLESDMLDEARRRNDPVLRNDCAYAHQNLNKAIDSSRADSGSQLPDWASLVLRRCADASLRYRGYQIDARPNLFQRSVVEAGIWAFYAKMRRRLQRENQWYTRASQPATADE